MRLLSLVSTYCRILTEVLIKTITMFELSVGGLCLSFFSIHKSFLVFVSVSVIFIVTVILICLIVGLKISKKKWQELVTSVKSCWLLL